MVDPGLLPGLLGALVASKRSNTIRYPYQAALLGIFSMLGKICAIGMLDADVPSSPAEVVRDIYSLRNYSG